MAKRQVAGRISVVINVEDPFIEIEHTTESLTIASLTIASLIVVVKKIRCGGVTTKPQILPGAEFQDRRTEAHATTVPELSTSHD